MISIGIIIVTFVAALITWVGFPGTFLMSIFALIWGWFIDFSVITVNHILIMFGISVVLEGFEFLFAGVAARYYGASKRSALFAIVGGIVGTILGAGMFLLVGAFLGLLSGSYLGAYFSERLSGKSSAESARAALGAVLGNIVSKTIKSTAAIAMGVWMIRVLVTLNG